MIKLNFIGQKNSGKSLSCFLIGKVLSKNKKVLLLNFDYFNKCKDFIKTKNWKTNEIIKVNKNFDLIDLKIINKKTDIEFKKELLFLYETIKDKYDFLLFDHPISFGELNLFLLENSNMVLCPFKVNSLFDEYFKKVKKILMLNQLKIKSLKFIPIMCEDNELNLSKMIHIRKQYMGLILDKINYYPFKKYDELIENKKLLNEYLLLSEKILKLI